MKIIIYILVLLLVSLESFAQEKAGNSLTNIVGEEIVYLADEIKLNGYLAYNSSVNDKRPGVLVVHEWWGHNEYARKRAEMLAELGYVAFAVDMYGDGKLAEHPNDAGKLMKQVTSDMSLAEKRLEAAIKVLHQQQFTDASKTAAIGYCFGGAMVLHLARSGVDIDGVVSFHGSLGTKSPAKKDVVQAKILVLHGEEDPFIPPEQVLAFKEEMTSSTVDYEFVAYPNVKHSFTNPQADEFSKKFDLPALQYNQHADEDSWKRMQAFFEKIF